MSSFDQLRKEPPRIVGVTQRSDIDLSCRLCRFTDGNKSIYLISKILGTESFLLPHERHRWVVSDQLPTNCPRQLSGSSHRIYRKTQNMSAPRI